MGYAHSKVVYPPLLSVFSGSALGAFTASRIDSHTTIAEPPLRGLVILYSGSLIDWRMVDIMIRVP